MCACGHHAVFHDLKGAKGRANPHLESDWHEVAWAVDAAGGLVSDHCAGSAFTPCPCVSYQPVQMPLRLVGRMESA